MNNSDKVSKFFTYGELYMSEGARRLGIDNTPTPEHLDNLIWFANNIGDKCREYVGGPLHISFYRSAALNAATPGAAPMSFHMLGMAGDIDCKHYGHGNNADLFRWLAKNVDAAQLIWEYGTDDQPDWIHVTAFPMAKGTIGGLTHNSKKLTRCIRENGQPKYIPFNQPL